MAKENVKERTALTPEELKRTVDEMAFEFETTEQVPKLVNIIGQERGRTVMEFGLEIDKPGYNLYISGISGTGKTTFTDSIIKKFSNRKVELFDWCYVNNFEDSHKPKVLKLPIGKGKELRDDMDHLIEILKVDLPKAFNDENYQREKAAIIRQYNEKIAGITKQMNETAAAHEFMIRQTSDGIIALPVVDGQPMNDDQFRQLSEEKVDEIKEKSALIQEKILDTTNKIRALEKEAQKELNTLDHRVAQHATEFHINELKRKYEDYPDVLAYLDAIQTDILNHPESFFEEKQNEDRFPFVPSRTKSSHDKYKVNLFVDNSETTGAPVITADNPTYYNLIGKVEYESRMGVMSTNFRRIMPGFLHEANGGYIIIQAKDIFSKAYAWEGLKRALLNRKLQIENMSEHVGLVATTSLTPDPIPLDVKVIMIGSMEIYQLLYNYDEDFRKLFKIRADFDVEMNYTLENMTNLASFVHTQCKEHNLRHFDRSAVAKLVEYSSRLAGHKGKLSTRFNQQVEIIYEADTWAKMMGDDLVSAKHVQKAIEEKEYRSSLYEEKLQESIDDGSILIDTEGKMVGQVNGLAVYRLGEYQFGKPSRITATTFVGQNGIVNIERESKMSGRIHNKGIYILGGYLGQKFAQKYPLALTAHIAFEQSYGGVDGDSASSTELYALLSSLADVPIDQGLAVTGSVNQKGEIQPVGGVNEKIEGFFTVCKNKGLTGKQGVLIPHQNVQNLMLKDEVVGAVKEGKFHIYAVKTIEEGIELLTGIPAGEMDKESGEYEKNTVYWRVAQKLKKYARFAEDSEKEDADGNVVDG